MSLGISVLACLLYVPLAFARGGHHHVDSPLDDIRVPGITSMLPGMECGYTVKREPAKVVSGALPGWLNGTFYHAVFSTNVTNAKPGTPGGLGAVLAVHFEKGAVPKASFDFVRGTNYHMACGEAPLDHYASSGAVTINVGCGEGNICAVSGMPEVTGLSAYNLDTTEAPRADIDDALGPKQNPYPVPYGPSFFSASHMPSDGASNYGTVYIFKPTPGYRLFRTNPTDESKIEVLPDIGVTPQAGDKTGGLPTFNHQGLMFTEHFIILPEMPLRMPANEFNWTAIQASWLPAGKLYFRVLDKATGAPLGRYSLPAHFTWHNVNAWENATHINLHTQLQQDERALNGFTGHLNLTEWHGHLVHVAMPNPTAAGAAKEGEATMAVLNAAADVSFEFGVVHPGYLWKAPTRYIYGGATDAAHAQDAWYPNVVRVDTVAAAAGDRDSKVLRFSPGGDWLFAPPMYLPKDAGQAADDAAGVVLLLVVSNVTGQPNMLVLDAATMTLAANVSIPVAGLVSMGLHNHFSNYPKST
jgi:hypothetical protein